MIKRLFSGQINNITIAALLVAFFSLVSRFLGIFRDRILASEFGAGDALDVYFAAFRIPDLVYNLLILGALTAGFMPVLIPLIKDYDCRKGDCEKNQKVWLLVNNVLNIFGVALIFLAVVGIAFAPFLMKFIIPGYDGDKRELTIELTRIMFLSPILLGLSGIVGGVLQSFRRFFVYSLAPVFYNIGIIVGALCFVPHFGMKGLAYGVVLGALFHFLIQLPAIYKLGFRYRPVFDVTDGELHRIVLMMIPRTISLAILQINLVVVTTIASTLESGSLAVFNFANNLQAFPVSIFGISFAIAAFPVLSRAASDNDRLVESFSDVFRRILFFIVPATVLLLTLRAQIIRVVYGSGEFDWAATIATMNTLGFFALSLFAQATIPLLTRVFYARHDSATPFKIGLFSTAVNVVLSLYFSRTMGVAGLALAFSVDSIVNFGLLWIMLRVKIGDLDEMRILVSTIKFSAAAVACGFAVQGIKFLSGHYVDMTRVWGVFVQGFCSGVFGILVYAAFCSLLHSEEFFGFWDSIKRRMPWKKAAINDSSEARGV